MFPDPAPSDPMGNATAPVSSASSDTLVGKCPLLCHSDVRLACLHALGPSAEKFHLRREGDAS